jgi:hypothetical protein
MCSSEEFTKRMTILVMLFGNACFSGTSDPFVEARDLRRRI